MQWQNSGVNMSEFEKLNPFEGNDLSSLNEMLWKEQRKGWLEALKWAREQTIETVDHYEHISLIRIEREIEELRNE